MGSDQFRKVGAEGRTEAGGLYPALATGKLAVKKAIRIARLPLSEQVAAMNGKVEKPPKAPASISLTKLAKVRDAIRNDKRLVDLTFAELFAVLCGEEIEDPTPGELRLRDLLTEKPKPGPKSKVRNGGYDRVPGAAVAALAGDDLDSQVAEAARRKEEAA